MPQGKTWTDKRRQVYIEKPWGSKISAANKGRVRSEEAKKKISLASRGRKHSVATRLKMSAAQMGNKKMIGKKRSVYSAFIFKTTLDSIY